jgi:U4/U6 small nuclear ribonucleoprotein PRP4
MESSTPTATLDLPASTQGERIQHAALLFELEAKKVAATLDVPTLPHHVRDALRKLGEPVRLFGENNANIRDRLRLCLGRENVRQRGVEGSAGANVSGGGMLAAATSSGTLPSDSLDPLDSHSTETTYSHALPKLVRARTAIAKYSLRKSKARLTNERKRRWGAARRAKRFLTLGIGAAYKPVDENGELIDEETVIKELTEEDDNCARLYESLRGIALDGSQYGDSRPFSALATARHCPSSSASSFSSRFIATGGWSGSIKLWNGNSELDLVAQKGMAHEDRIMGIAMHQVQSKTLLATSSIDLTGKIWTVQRSEGGGSQNKMNTAMEIDLYDNDKNEGDRDSNSYSYSIHEEAVLKGHKARLCSVAFHPSGGYIGTTSFDHTWRLWDVEYNKEATQANRTANKIKEELLLQDGHWKEVYGIGFHGDGSLVSTSDYAGVVHVWDLRTGKSACNFMVRLLCPHHISMAVYF